ncbi:G2/mitotic-specific cyclin 2 [Pancytospora philotis]|nr:G2/mitotic-specific cyclin 2 [Pancytospora philotis]
MPRRVCGVPLKNITNRPAAKKSGGFTEAEHALLEAHRSAERAEICSVGKYIDQVVDYYESLDTVFCYVEKDITYEMRSLLVDWIISCSENLRLSDDTLYLSVHLIDRFLSGRALSTAKLQLVGITALVVAAKYEEVVCPDLSSFLLLTDKSFAEEDIKRAEKFMLYSLDYRLEFVSPLYFLRRAARANNYEARSRRMAKYFLELMALHACFARYRKSILGTTAMYLARKICQTDHNKNLLFYYARIERGDMRGCFNELVQVIYSSPKYENVENKYAKAGAYGVNLIAREYAQKNFN